MTGSFKISNLTDSGHLRPGHVGIIPDGTRRYALVDDLDLSHAYIHTMEKINQWIEFLFQHEINSISIYLSSKENLIKRQPEQLTPLFAAQTYLFSVLLPETARVHPFTAVCAGDKALNPPEVLESLNSLCQRAKNTREKKLNLCLGYNPIDELDHAIKESPTSMSVFEHLWVPEEIDLVIRTGGAKRLSNFLPLQSGYAEICFIQKNFPDSSLSDLQSALDAFEESSRRFGE